MNRLNGHGYYEHAPLVSPPPCHERGEDNLTLHVLQLSKTVRLRVQHYIHDSIQSVEFMLEVDDGEQPGMTYHTYERMLVGPTTHWQWPFVRCRIPLEILRRCQDASFSDNVAGHPPVDGMY